MTIIDALSGIWNKILEIMSLFVIPDWAELIKLLPVFIFLGVVGPLVTFFMLGTLAYQVTKPRTKVSYVEGPRVAEIGANGQPIFPPGLPHCRNHSLIYPSGTTRCERGDEALAVICPMCGLGREAWIDTCSNCGLVLQVKNRPVPAQVGNRPKPGGAALA